MESETPNPRATPQPSSRRLPGVIVRGLRSRAQTLDASINIGRAGVTPAVVATLETALGANDLVKVRFVEHKGERDTLAMGLADATDSHLVWQIGHVAVFYRAKPRTTGVDAAE